MGARAILDANLLLVYAIGTCNPQLLGRHRRVKEYMPEDYRLLLNLVNQFDQIVLTPNAVTECSDLLKDSDCENDAKEVLKELVSNPRCLVIEEYVPSSKAVHESQYKFLGVADCAMLSLIDDETVLISADGALSREAMRRNAHSINFNHYRNFAA